MNDNIFEPFNHINFNYVQNHSAEEILLGIVNSLTSINVERKHETLKIIKRVLDSWSIAIDYELLDI